MSLLQDLLGPKRGFDGGLFLPDHKSITARRPIEILPTEGPLRVPLQVAGDLPTRTIVSPGDQVIRGQRIADAADTNSIPVHSPICGKITAIEETWTALDGAMPAAVIEPDGREDVIGKGLLWQNESFINQLAERGVLCHRPRRAAHRVILDAIAKSATVLIVNAMETEPYLTSDLRTMVEQPGRIVDATCEIADAIGVTRAIIALPYRHRRVVKRLRTEAHARHLEIAALANAFPQCHPTLLVKTLLQEEIEPGGDTLDAGVLVLPLATVRYISDALIADQPVTHTLLTIGGDRLERAGTYQVDIGTPIRQLANQLGINLPVAKMIVGGLMTGIALERDDIVVTAEMNGLLFLSSVEQDAPQPCVHCGWCVEDCPTGVDPTRLFALESHADCTEDERYELRACIDCGLCTYVCPSHLPLAETFVRLRSRFNGDVPVKATP